LNGTIKCPIPREQMALLLIRVANAESRAPFTLSPLSIYTCLKPSVFEYLLDLAKRGRIKVYKDISPKDIHNGEKKGDGTSGRVVKASWNNQPVAVKYFFVADPPAFRHELTLITLLKHPKLIQSFGGYAGEGTALLVTELLDCNLFEFLRKTPVTDIGTKVKLAMDIAQGMEFVHSKKIIHRDLKSVNVLLNLVHPITAKVCDFGLCRVLDTENIMTNNVGTVAWIAPEVFESSKIYSEKCDVYSFGIILYELLTHLVPFREVTFFNIPNAVMKKKRPVLPPDLVAPRAYIDLMKACWHSSPHKRPSFAEICAKLWEIAPLAVENLEASTSREKWLEYPTDSEDEDDGDDDDDTSESEAGPSNLQEQEQTSLLALTAMLQEKNIKSSLITEELKVKALRSRNFHVHAARKTIQTYLTFINYYNHGKSTTIQCARKAFDLQVLTFYGGVNTDGGPIIFFDAPKHFVETLPVNELVSAMLYCIDRANEMPEAFTAGVTLLVNTENWTMKNYSMKYSRALATLLQELPFVFKHLICVNSPPWMSKMYVVFYFIMGKLLWSKMKIIEGTSLPQYVTIENLLPEMGGTFDFDRNHWLRKRHDIEKLKYIP